MVAYSFKQQFELPIRARTKIGTIRAVGKRRHARPEEPLQLYTGMRTKRCRLIARATCAYSDDIIMVPYTAIVSIGGRLLHGKALDDFAVGDGFSDFGQMREFWAKVHPGIGYFRGVWTRWTADSVVEAP